MSAAPPSVSKNATIIETTADGHMKQLRAGTNGWLCMPDPSQLDTLPTDPRNGGPWVMWKGTKYAHIMMPIASD